jgi:hypothetical protein
MELKSGRLVSCGTDYMHERGAGWENLLGPTTTSILMNIGDSRKDSGRSSV